MRTLTIAVALVLAGCGDTYNQIIQEADANLGADAGDGGSGPDAGPFTPRRGYYSLLFSETQDDCNLPTPTSDTYEVVLYQHTDGSLGSDLEAAEDGGARIDWLCMFTNLSIPNYYSFSCQTANNEGFTPFTAQLPSGGIMTRTTSWAGQWTSGPEAFEGGYTVRQTCTGANCTQDCQALGLVCPCEQDSSIMATWLHDSP